MNIKCLAGKGAAPASGLPYCVCFSSFVTIGPTWFRAGSQARNKGSSAGYASCWSKRPADLNPMPLSLINNVDILKRIHTLIRGFVTVVAPVTLHEEGEFSASLHLGWLGILEFERWSFKRAIFGKFPIDEDSKL